MNALSLPYEVMKLCNATLDIIAVDKAYGQSHEEDMLACRDTCHPDCEEIEYDTTLR